MDTIALDKGSWDLTLDFQGNIAILASERGAVAQDAASEIRLFKGELYYDVAQGIPYFQSILGYAPPLQFLKTKFIGAALNVPQTVKAKAFIKSIKNRKVTGQVQILDEVGKLTVVNF